MYMYLGFYIIHIAVNLFGLIVYQREVILILAMATIIAVHNTWVLDKIIYLIEQGYFTWRRYTKYIIINIFNLV